MPISYSDAKTLFLSDASSLTAEAGSVINWVKAKLGYPTLNVELTNDQITFAMEEAIIEYSAEISKFKAKNSYLSLIGIKKDTDLTKTSPMPSLKFLKRYMAQFGTEAGSGGAVNYKKAYFLTQPSKASYDFSSLFDADTDEPIKYEGSVVPIHIYHNKQNYGYKFMDPLAGSNFLLYKEFGQGDAYAMNSRMLYAMPLYENLLRFQWFENFDKMFKSQYSWNVVGSTVTLSPVPQETRAVYVEWADSVEIDNKYSNAISNISDASLSAYTTDITNIPFNNLNYNEINDFSKNWIRKYTFALCKQILGNIRGKISNLPSADGDINLNSSELIIDGRESAIGLKEELEKFLGDLVSSEMVEREGKILDVGRKYQALVPLKIYIR